MRLPRGTDPVSKQLNLARRALCELLTSKGPNHAYCEQQPGGHTPQGTRPDTRSFERRADPSPRAELTPVMVLVCFQFGCLLVPAPTCPQFWCRTDPSFGTELNGPQYWRRADPSSGRVPGSARRLPGSDPAGWSNTVAERPPKRACETDQTMPQRVHFRSGVIGAPVEP